MSSRRPEYVRPLLRRLAAPPPLLSAPKHQLAGYGGVGGAADDGGVDDLFALLDRLAAGAADAAATARALAVAAEALALRAGSAGGLRSGPASNGEWTPALVLMRADRRAEAVAALAAVRERWRAAGDARMLVRAARHYEGAAAVCTSLCVRSCLVVSPSAAPAPPEGAWALAQAPARIDLAGGWSDTPPVCYEHGGLVICAAISVEGRCPIGARARRLRDPIVRLLMGGAPIVCTELADLEDHASPLAPGALPKTVLVFCGLVDLGPDAAPLADQLRARGGGIEIESWSRLPQGSGLGTSSILAAALVACVSSALGVRRDASDLTHAVLQVEQLLTTGGGWQDQVGGILPGVKACSSAAALPLAVTSDVLPLPLAALQTLSRHLQLIYTGKTRLARNLLQDVLRRWYSANPAIVANVDALIANAGECRAALLRGDLAAVGACLDAYWEQKKRMCDAEPPAVTKMLARLRPLVHGAALAGAGGGGFLFCVTKEPDAADAVRAALDGEGELREVAIDEDGLRCSVQQPGEPAP